MSVAKCNSHWPAGVRCASGAARRFSWEASNRATPDYPNSRSPQFDFTNGQLVVPHPPTSREEIQEPFVREMEIDPKDYYPKDYRPILLPTWPVEGDLVIPLDKAPADPREGMGEAWRLRLKNRKVLDEQKKQAGAKE